MSFLPAPSSCIWPLLTFIHQPLAKASAKPKKEERHLLDTKHFIILKLGYSEQVGLRGRLDRQGSFCAIPSPPGSSCLCPLALPAQQGPQKESSKFQDQTWLPLLHAMPFIPMGTDRETCDLADQSKG